MSANAEPAKRVQDYSDIDDSMPCYLKMASTWYLYLPNCGLANLTNHTIEEHEDGTISVTPSIRLTGHKDGERTQRHGYLMKGIWNEC